MLLRVGGYIVPVDHWCLCHDPGGPDIALVWLIEREYPLERGSVASSYRRSKARYACRQSHGAKDNENGLRVLTEFAEGRSVLTSVTTHRGGWAVSAVVWRGNSVLITPHSPHLRLSRFSPNSTSCDSQSRKS